MKNTATKNQKREFKLNNEPISYQLCIHIRNFLKSQQPADVVTRHMGNLEMHYGSEVVEEAIRNFFPSFHARYYQVCIPKTMIGNT